MTTKRKHDLSKDHSTNVTDEVFNAASHLAGALFALTGLVLLVVYAGVAGKPWHVVSFSIYGVSLVSLFLASALHHGVNASARIERVLWVIDHIGNVTHLYITIQRHFSCIYLENLNSSGNIRWQNIYLPIKPARSK